jgi:phosphate transport system substrate-binding protein
LKLSVKKLAVSAGLMAGLAGTMFVSMAPAGAIPAADGNPQILAAVGSDTIYWVSNNLTAAYNVNALNPDHDRLVNVPPVVTSPFPTGAIVPFDTVANGNCNSTTATETYPGIGGLVYDATHAAPNGSGAGITALNGDTNDCIDVARSSRTKSVSDPASDEFYSFALDALDWVKFPGSHAPTNLTRAQIHDIYTCDSTTHTPIISNWNQVGGTAGVIKKYAPQTQSGTYSFFKSQFLGGVDVDTNCVGAANLSTFLEEHDARGVTAINKPNAILPFSWAQFTSDAKGATPDLRNGVAIQSLEGLKPTATSVNESPTGTSGHFNGTRLVNFVLKNTGGTYTQVMRFAGVDSTGPGFICNNLGASIIRLYGFVPLKKAATGGGVGGSGSLSFCRKNAAAL